MSDPSTGRIGARLRRRILSAVIVGPLVGLAVGAAIAAFAFGSWGRASVMVLIAAVVAGTLLALLVAGYSSLESPDPGREPSDTERPVADREGLVREESGGPAAYGEQRRATTPEGS